MLFVFTDHFYVFAWLVWVGYTFTQVSPTYTKTKSILQHKT